MVSLSSLTSRLSSVSFPGVLVASSFAAVVAQAPPEVGRLVWRSQEGFTAISAIRELADGRVIIADSREKRIVVLSPQGQSLTEVGRTGEGPGEFALPYSLMPFRAESTIVTDVMLRRYLVIGPDLKIARTTSFPATASWAAQGQIVVGEEEILGLAGMPTPEAPSVTLSRLSLRTGEIRSIMRLASAPPVPIEAGGRQIVVNPSFAANDTFAVASNGQIAVVRTSNYRVDWFNRDGNQLAAGPPTPYEPVPFAPQERRGPFGSTIPGPATKPAFDGKRIHIDGSGVLWVGRSERLGSTGHRYDLFDTKGHRMRTVTLPVGRVLIGFGHRATYLVFTDADGLEWLERYAP
jgi:hypothetical protein